MRLIETSEDGLPVYSAEARMIKEFNAIIKRDKGKGTGLKELALVHFLCVFDSRYNLYDDDIEKIKRIADDVDLPKNWKPDQLIVDAANKYKDLVTTRSSRIVEKADSSIKKVEDFLDGLDLTSEENKTTSGGLVIKPKDVQDLIKGMPDMIKAVQESEKLVRKELEEQSGKKLRTDLGMFEQKATKLDQSKAI